MEYVERILDILQHRRGTGANAYFVPGRWNEYAHAPATVDPGRPGEVLVDPGDFLAAGIEHAVQEAAAGMHLVTQGRPDVMHHVIYGMLLRSFTAWPHHDVCDICSGTFLKTMVLLPSLRRFGTDIVYLLPVFRFSDRYRKGELGSPYAIRDVYRLDPGLHDEVLGDFSNELLETEFAAFVELCHALGMKVVLDFAFRTAARDNVLISEHPDWFYWIRMDFASRFQAPTVGHRRMSPGWDDGTLRRLYASARKTGYLAQFTQPPNLLDPDQWPTLRDTAGDDLLGAIEEHMGVTTVPGFSDVLNDRQPAWTDATYLRYYNENPVQAALWVPQGHAPFIMQDGVRLDGYHGEKPNEGLWQYVTGVLPYYRTRFGIDGARIDMAPAMPAELNAQMVRRIREMDPDFLLWSEELHSGKGAQAQRDGFDFISGLSYYGYKRVHYDDFEGHVLGKGFLASPIPVTASVETPDTPRAALVHRDRASLRLVLMLNCLMPNAVPFINAGQELLEVQPMNLGLDNTEEGRWVLPPDDLMAGRLAFFDRACLHWMTADPWADEVLQEALRLRRAYLPLLSDPGSFVKEPVPLVRDKLTMLCYHDTIHGIGLVVAANRSSARELAFSFRARCPAELQDAGHVLVVEDADGPCRRPLDVNETLFLRPCEVVLLDIET
jgi:starch synthase (maltosyl-transferring)